MRYALFVLLLVTGSVDAAPPRKMVEDLRQAMMVNFEACNREDVDGLLASCAASMPRQDEFRRESAETFEEKDIYYRLLDLTNVEVRGEWARARVVQETLTRDERGSNDAQNDFYREHSGLLTANEVVEYLQVFRKEVGTWKLYMIVSKPRQLSSREAMREFKRARTTPATQSVFRTNCQNGRCEMPGDWAP